MVAISGVHVAFTYLLDSTRVVFLSNKTHADTKLKLFSVLVCKKRVPLDGY